MKRMTLEVVTVLRPPRPTAALPLTLSESQVAALPPLDARARVQPNAALDESKRGTPYS